MGVPAFFRWLCARNPQFILDAHENYENFDAESLNPEMDNLYLDMNGIIHPCCRSDGSVVPIAHSIQDMFNNIFMYIDKLVDICRPKRILYMAIDGVAPRAKMNQQRARRFKGAKEAVELQQKKEELLREYTDRSEINDDILAFVQNRFDTNVITPGTAFMRDLSKALEHYVIDRMNNHPLFKGLQVIFSDAGIPGEGEHKILDFIRVQRHQVGYDPNTKHCLYGADADLIMLGLSTHEPYFYIIREQIITQEEKKCSICNQQGHFQMECPNEMQLEAGQKFIPASVLKEKEQQVRKGVLQNFQFAKLYVMRQYINMRFAKFFMNVNDEQILKMKYDIEKVIDDFVFMCFFVGNDFLPHIPNLSIRDGGIDALLAIYEHTLTQAEDYLTNNGELNLKQVAKFIENMALVEEDLMKFRKDKEEKDKRFHEINKEKEAKLQSIRPHISEEEYQRKRKEWRLRDEKKVDIINNETLLQRFKRSLQEKQNESKTIKEIKEGTQVTLNYNYKFAYYNDKFGVKPKDFIQIQQLIKQSYVEALCWNFAYYYKGCISWGWYYPFHYSPFASDLLDIDQHIIEFDLGEPFKPFYQLLAVFPPASALSVPPCFQTLMISPDSEIADFYPSDFYVDLIGKKFEWLGEVILPFIEEDRLLKAAQKYEHLLTLEEQKRNSFGQIMLFFNQTVHTYPPTLNQPEHHLTGTLGDFTKYPLNTGISLLDPSLNIKRVSFNNIVCKPISSPPFEKHDIYLLEGLIEPQEEISDSYIEKADMRTYQGENMIRLIKRILSRQEESDQWEKIAKNRNNYISGQSVYGNTLNVREMTKYQNQMDNLVIKDEGFKNNQLSSGFEEKNAIRDYSQQTTPGNINPQNNIFNHLEDRDGRYQRTNNQRNQFYNNESNSGYKKNYFNQQGNSNRGGGKNIYPRNNNVEGQNKGIFNDRNQQSQASRINYQTINHHQPSYDLNNVSQLRNSYSQQNYINVPNTEINRTINTDFASNAYRDNPNKKFEPAQPYQPKFTTPSYLNTFHYNQNLVETKKNQILENEDEEQEYDPIEAIKKKFKNN